MALPSGYTQLEYIQSSGTQYINTGFKPNQNTRIVMDVQAVGTSGTYFAFGARQSTTSNAFCLFFYNGWAADYQTGNQRKTFSSIAFTDRLKIDFDKTVCTVNGQTATFTAATFQSPVEMMLLAVNTNGTIANTLAAKLYSCKIYDNGTLVRDFVPAKNSAGTVGLYDLANGTFYTNTGTGSFTAGPLASGPVEGNGASILAGVSFAVKEGTAMLNGVARKITEGMTILGGTAKKIAVAAGIDVAAMVISYSGAYTDQSDVVMSGKHYRLLTLTGSGTLTFNQQVNVDVWMVGGGSKGDDNYETGSTTYKGAGGAGGYSLFEQGIQVAGSVVATVGSQNGASSFGSYATKAITESQRRIGKGGTGGGLGRSRETNSAYTGEGDGKSKYPFENSTLFTKPHSGGGGGGANKGSSFNYRGYDGGTNGGNAPGTLQGTTTGSGTEGGLGGNSGGGAGGSTSSRSGKAATYYGGGGGGAGYSSSGAAYNYGGAGYQGVIYVRIPYEQE